MIDAFIRRANVHRAVQRLGIVPLLHQKLQQLHKLTSSHRLQQQFLVASLGVLCPDWEPTNQCLPEVICNFFCLDRLTASMPLVACSMVALLVYDQVDSIVGYLVFTVKS